MSAMKFFRDGLSSLVTGLGTSNDKAYSAQFMPSLYTDLDFGNAYRTNWMAGKVVDIPAEDATREWRTWNADEKQAEKLAAAEARLGLKRKTREALKMARLWGGGALIIGTGDGDPSKPLNPKAVGIGGLKYVASVSRKSLVASTDIDRDVSSPNFKRPAMYSLPTGTKTGQQVHPSRVVRLVGVETLDDIMPNIHAGWGDSVLMRCLDAVKRAEGTDANVASMIYEAKIDVIRIQEFMQNLGSLGKEYEQQVLKRFALVSAAKSNNNVLLLDKDDEFERKSTNFANLPDLMDRFPARVAAAADIPITRFLGQSPAGLNATGESDLRNYYDSVATYQETDLTPELAILDECLVRSTIGRSSDEVTHTWNPLWQLGEKDKAEVGKGQAEIIKTLVEIDVLPLEVATEVAAGALTETGTLSRLQAAMDKHFGGGEPNNTDTDEDLLGNV